MVMQCYYLFYIFFSEIYSTEDEHKQNVKLSLETFRKKIVELTENDLNQNYNLF